MATFCTAQFWTTFVPYEYEGDDETVGQETMKKWESTVFDYEVKRTKNEGKYMIETVPVQQLSASAAQHSALLAASLSQSQSSSSSPMPVHDKREWTNTGAYVEYVGKVALKCGMKPLGTETNSAGLFSSVKWLAPKVEGFFQCCVSAMYFAIYIEFLCTGILCRVTNFFWSYRMKSTLRNA
jgi:hypothetical protein